MCEESEQLDNKIRRCRRLVLIGLDPLTVERINAMIVELEAAKAAIRPGQANS
jgi:hypothetical protein